jgi:hypothetical protein
MITAMPLKRELPLLTLMHQEVVGVLNDHGGWRSASQPEVLSLLWGIGRMFQFGCRVRSAPGGGFWWVSGSSRGVGLEP